MAGNKNSGRRGRHEEAKLFELSHKAVMWAIDNFDQMTRGEKMKVLTQLSVKYIPQKMEHDGLPETRIILVTPKESRVADRVESLSV